MYIEIQYPTRVYWRVFPETDTVFVLGLADGWVQNGDTLTNALTVPRYKIEFKFGDALGPFLLQPGPVFSDSDRLRLLPDGTLVRIPVAVPPVRPGIPDPSQVRPTTQWPWAILLCRFSDAPDEPRPQQFYADFFTRNGTGGMCDYWRTVTMGAVDISGSQVFGWMPMTRTEAQGRALTFPRDRGILYQWGRDAAQAAGIDLSRFRNVLVLQNRSIDHGASGTNVLIQHGNPAVCEFAFIAHEMGHGFGLPHSLALPNFVYGDHWDLMSWQTSAFWFNASFQGAQGLATGGLNARNLRVMGGLPDWRVWRPAGPDFSTAVALSPLNQPPVGAGGFLAAQMPPVAGRDSTFSVEFRQRGGWDRAITQHTVLVHEIKADGQSYIYPARGANLFVQGQSVALPPEQGITVHVQTIDPTGDQAVVRLWDAPEGSLRKEDSDPRVYRIDNGKKRWIVSEAVFNRLRLRWDRVRSVPDGVLAGIPNGLNITARSRRFGPNP